MSNVRFLKSGPKSNPYLTRSLRGPANDLNARSRSDRVVIYTSSVRSLFNFNFLLIVDDDDDETKSCSNICQNLLNCSLGYIYKHIGTRKFLTKPLWVYSHLKSGFLFLQKVT